MADALIRSASIDVPIVPFASGIPLVAPPPPIQQPQQAQAPILPPVSPEARSNALARLRFSREGAARSIHQPILNRIPALARVVTGSSSSSSNSRSNVIDLTGSSPPSTATKVRGCIRRGGSGGGAIASGSGSNNTGGAGPSGIRRNGNSNVIVIDSDEEEDGDVPTLSDDDDDIVIVEGSYAAPVPVAREVRRPGPAAARVANAIARPARRQPAAPLPPLPPARVIPPQPRPLTTAQQRQADIDRYAMFDDFDSYGSGDGFSDDGWDSEDQEEAEFRALYAPDDEEAEGGEHFSVAGQLNRLFEFLGGNVGGDRGREALQNYYAQGGGNGLVGVINGAGKKKVAKKYGVRASHPKAVEDGFSRDIIPPPELADTPPPEPISRGKKSIKPKLPSVQMEPACAACLGRILLAQNGERKPWGLKCGHVVCGKCIGEAKMRCEEIKEAERKSHWSFDVGIKGKGKKKAEVVFLDDEDEEEVDSNTNDKNDSNFGPTRRSASQKVPNSNSNSAPYSKTSPGKAKGKGKEKSRGGETGVDESWTCCPVVKCNGTTDLLAKDGDFSGPFELFI